MVSAHIIASICGIFFKSIFTFLQYLLCTEGTKSCNCTMTLSDGFHSETLVIIILCNSYKAPTKAVHFKWLQVFMAGIIQMWGLLEFTPFTIICCPDMHPSEPNSITVNTGSPTSSRNQNMVQAPGRCHQIYFYHYLVRNLILGCFV